MMDLPPERLATILFEELDRDGWGDIDPAWIEAAMLPGDPIEDEPDVDAMRLVLDRVAQRLMNDFNKRGDCGK